LFLNDQNATLDETSNDGPASKYDATELIEAFKNWMDQKNHPGAFSYRL
jgi:hypothetical protein